MKIVQVTHRYFPYIGGIEKIVQEISERLAKRDHEIIVITTDQSGSLPKREIINGVEVIRFKSFAPGDAFYLTFGLYSYIKNIDFDFIHAHNYHAFPAIFACLANNKRKFIFSPYYHGKGHTFVRNLLHIVYKLTFGNYILKNSELIITLSDFEIDLIKKKFRNIQNDFIAISPGVDDDFFKTARSSHKHIKSILYVGRIEEYKGIQYIFHALEYLSNISDDRYVLNIVGAGPYMDKLHKIAEKSKVEVIWHGWATGEKLLHHYMEADVLVLLSSYETFGIVVAEALAAKLPALVVKSSALREFVDDKVCFSVDDPADPAELGDKILEICDMEIDFSGLSDVKVRSWDEVVDEYEQVYLDICE